nr:hypothetical protein [Tanacetum cinerariifolium]
MEDENPIHTLGDYSKPSHEGYRNTIELPVGNNVSEIDRPADDKLHDKNTYESWEIIKNLPLYDHEGWNDTDEVSFQCEIDRLVDDKLSFHDHVSFHLNFLVVYLFFVLSVLLTTMGDENPIRTLGDYSKPGHEGYMNTIELPIGNNVVPLQSDTIQLVQNECSFHGLRIHHHMGDFTTRFLAQFFPPGRTAKLRNDILMFLQHHGESPSKAWIRFKDLLQKVPHHGIDLWLEDLTLYDNESWNDPRDFAKPVKEITLPQDVSMNKITTSCEIYNGPHDTLYFMENPKQAFVDYSFSRTDEAGDARLSMFEADSKQQQSEMTNKIDTVLKAITDRIVRTLPSDTAHLKEATISQTSMQQPEEPEPTLEDEFQYLHLNLSILEVLAHAPIYNAILDKYVESLELGKNRSTFVQGEIPAKIEDPRLFTLPCSLGGSKLFDTLVDLGSRVNIIPLYLFKKLYIGLLEESDHIFGLADGTKSYPIEIVKDVEVHIGKLKLLNDFYVIDMKKDPETPLLVGRGFLATANTVIDCRMAKIAVGEGITRSVFSVKGVDLDLSGVASYDGYACYVLETQLLSVSLLICLRKHDCVEWIPSDTKVFFKPIKAISTPQSISKTPDRRLLELEDHINFLLKGSRLTPRPSSTHIPQAYAEAVYSNPRPQNQNGPPKQNPFTFHKHTGPNPQPQALGTTFKARVRDYMVAHTKRMKRFKNAIFEQREKINEKMTEMFGILKELTTSRAPKKVLIREEANISVTKNVNSISLTRWGGRKE